MNKNLVKLIIKVNSTEACNKCRYYDKNGACKLDSTEFRNNYSQEYYDEYGNKLCIIADDDDEDSSVYHYYPKLKNILAKL